MEVDGCVDAADIAEKFAEYFTSCYSYNSLNHSEAFRDEYVKLRTNSGLPCLKASFDTELVSKIMMDLKRGRAAGIDGLSNEHLSFRHPILSVILSRLFNLILSSR